jgi:hypothetical protein
MVFPFARAVFLFSVVMSKHIFKQKLKKHINKRMNSISKPSTLQSTDAIATANTRETSEIGETIVDELRILYNYI